MAKILRVAVALSGGVDSAVAAVLLKNKGYDIIGTFIKYWDSNDDDAKTMRKDLEDTRWFCHKLKIPFQEVDLVNEYWRDVYPIIADYNVGYTPSADTICNEHILFECYHRYCLEKLDVDAVATGHYARSSFGSFFQHYKPDQFPSLLRSADMVDDQTYILSRIARKTLQRTMFPVGEFTKAEVRNIARQHSLEKILQKKESLDVCFMNVLHFKSFISRYVLGKPGKFLHVDNGEVVGEHQGLHHWPIGCCYLDANFVVGNDEKNIIFVAPSRNHPAFYCRSLTLSYCHWINEEFKKKFFRATFQYKHDQTLLKGTFVDLLDYPEGGYVFLESETPLYAALPGQYVVMYAGDECLGSMKILNTGPSDVFYQNETKSSKSEFCVRNLVVNK